MASTIMSPPRQKLDEIEQNRARISEAIYTYLQTQNRILDFKQVEAVRSVAKVINSGEDPYVDLPTGTGKTVIISQIVEAIRKSAHNMKILIVTFSKPLVEQTKLRFEEHSPDIPVGMYYSYAKDIHESVIVTTYASLPHFARYHALEFGFLVLDEAHLILTDARIKFISFFKNAVKFAATATPAYSDDKTLEDHFTLAYKMSVEEAIESELVCGFRNIKVSSYFSNLNKVKICKNGDFDTESLEKEVNIYSRNKSAVEFYRSAIDPYTGNPLLGKRGLVHCVSVSHAYAVTDVFKESISSDMIGGKTICEVIHGGSDSYSMSAKMRKSILEAHRHGEILLLAYSKLLLYGHDDKKIECTLNLAPSASVVIVQQRGGRCTRFNKSDPFKTALIVDFIDEQTNQKNNALLYGEVVGSSSYVLPKVQRTFLKQSDYKKFNGEQLSIDQQESLNSNSNLLKGLNIYWFSEEVKAIISQKKHWRKNGAFLNSNEEGILSINQIAQILKIKIEYIRDIVNRLKPTKKNSQLYFDPLKYDKNNLVTFQIVIKYSLTTEIRYLKTSDLELFRKIYVPYQIKQDDEISIPELSRLCNTYEAPVKEIFERLKPLEGKEELYYDPEENSPGEPTAYHVVLRRYDLDKPMFCLKKNDYEKFNKKYFQLENKKKNELSPWQIAHKLKRRHEPVLEILNRLKPAKGKTNLYVDPLDKKRKPQTFRMTLRRGGTHDMQPMLCLLNKDYEKFRKAFFPFDKKGSDDLSYIDIARRAKKLKIKIPAYRIREFLYRLRPVKGCTNLYFDKQLKTKNLITFRIVMRRGPKGEQRCLKAADFAKFIKQFKSSSDKKQPDELSSIDVSKELRIAKKTSYNIFSRLKPFPRNKNLYYDPEIKPENRMKFKIVIRKLGSNELRCLKKKELELFAKQYGLEYRI